MNLHIKEIRYPRTLIAAGYVMMCLLAVGIMYLWFYEWRELETLEAENRRINGFRQEVHHVYGEMTGLSLLGESVLEWDDDDLGHYHVLRMVVDSLLYRFKTAYPAERIDSVRHLLESKEILLRAIVEVLDEQESLNRRIAERVPVIAAKSAQEQPKKPKRKGFLGLFRKKENPKPTVTTTMLHTLNSKEIAQQQAQSRLLSEHADSLAIRNSELNRQLQSLIGQMDRKVEHDLQQREAEITAMRERSFLQIGSLTGFIFLLLVVSYIIIHRDIQRIRRYKAKTVNLIRQLHESDMQNRELISSRKKAMYTITHELRTPLTAIHGYAELMQGHGTDSTSRYAESILLASDRMITMLNMLLDFFRLDSGKEVVNAVPFRLQGVADTLSAEFTSLAEAKDLCLTVECCNDVILIDDKERIMQVCGNLLSNAIKFTQIGSVSLRMDYNGSVLSVVVEDTGSGMSEEEQQRVFGAFERLSNAATQDGFGLGLSIVKRIVDMLDGTIRLDSKKGLGSRFTIEIPMQTADIAVIEEKEVQEQYQEPDFERAYSVIMLDDNDILLSMARDMYAHYGIHCEICTNTGDLMEAIRSENYDLLITDLKMPDTNGYEVLELLRSSDIGNSKTIPVVVATASGSCTEEELLAYGFSACLFKPFGLSELMAVSEKSLSSLQSSKDEYPDLTSLLAYGDKATILNKLITETDKDMQAISDARERCDRKELNMQVHRLRSSWAVIRADKPLWELHRLLHSDTECSDNEIQHAVNAVLAMGNRIVEQAKRRKEDGL
ncbi:MAG: hybrid sensor histidine kinase/response regulator [Bacteroidales bacterium]|nr:hybrid sensor histidine kinase/response regulator [Bacteroidales bacterium]